MLLSNFPLCLFVWLLFSLIVRADIKIDAVDDPWNPVDSRLFKGFYPPEDKGSCDEGQEDKIWADIDVAKKMAKDTVNALNLGTTQDIGTLANGVFTVLFSKDEYADVKTQLSLVDTISNENKIVIFCSEDHHVMRPDNSRNPRSTWEDSTWLGKGQDGNFAFVKIGREIQLDTDANAPVPDPRQHICQSEETMDAYTSVGDHELAGEFHIVLCPSYFNGNSQSSKLDTRSINDINSQGLKRDPNLNSLDFIYPSSRTILHEFMHVIGGPMRDIQGTPHFQYSSLAAPQFIHDTPVCPCYGFTNCAKVKEKYEAETETAVRMSLTPSRNADSFVSLCLAVAIQPGRDSAGNPITRLPNTFMWFLGSVDVDTGEPVQALLAQAS